MQELVAEFLDQTGYHVIPAANGREALSLFEADPAAVQLLLADIMLPGGMNGLGDAKAFRQITPSFP